MIYLTNKICLGHSTQTSREASVLLYVTTVKSPKKKTWKISESIVIIVVF
jgi:hypothetical protein